MAQKVRNAHLAVGAWNRNLNCYIQQEQVPQKIEALLQDKLLAMGRRVDLWLNVNADTPGVVACTCDKETRPASDFRCLSCFGHRLIPGYLRFLHETIFFASAEFAGFALTNVEVDRTIKPNRLRLNSTSLTGTIITPDKAFSNAKSRNWLTQVAAFRKTSTDTITVEFSTDAGVTWVDITLINGAAKPTGTGGIRFRVTLTRLALTTDSPDFEILRILHPQPDRMTKQSKARGDLEPGQILVLKTWAIEQTLRLIAAARQVDWQQDKSWTAPLSFFDSTLSPNTPPCLISDEDAGPHPFFRHANGVTEGQRFALYQVSHSDELLQVFTYQSFSERRTQPNELYNLVV